jgi:hypothetical protein
VEVAASDDGFQHWLEFMLVSLHHRINVTDLANREISQALYFRHGGLRAWIFRDLLPENAFWLPFHGCTMWEDKCNCWFRYVNSYDIFSM